MTDVSFNRLPPYPHCCCRRGRPEFHRKQVQVSLADRDGSQHAAAQLKFCPKSELPAGDQQRPGEREREGHGTAEFSGAACCRRCLCRRSVSNLGLITNQLTDRTVQNKPSGVSVTR